MSTRGASHGWIESAGLGITSAKPMPIGKRYRLGSDDDPVHRAGSPVSPGLE